MYKELAAELRIFETVCKHSNKPDTAFLARRAADAIEKLSKRKECPFSHDDGKFCALLGTYVSIPKEDE